MYEYKTINISLEPLPEGDREFGKSGPRKATVATAANRWAEMGWRTVAVMPALSSGYADSILIEREVGINKVLEKVARDMAADLREEFPDSDIPGYIEREFGKQG